LRRVVWWKFTDVSEVLAASIIAPMMEAANTSEKSVNFCKTTRRNKPEDSHFRKNLKNTLSRSFEVILCLSREMFW
jgi:hypothetical protein